MTDIVERLRENAKIAWGYPGMLPWPAHGSPLPNEAADTIEALRAENARLKDNLESLCVDFNALTMLNKDEHEENAKLRAALKSILTIPAKPIHLTQDYIITVPEYVLFEAAGVLEQSCKAAKRAAIGESDE